MSSWGGSAGGGTSVSSDWDRMWGDDDDANEDDFGDGQQEESSIPFWMNKDSIIFLIDCSETMFQPDENGEIPFHNAIRCATETLQEKIISSDTDLVGVCFYGTKEKRNPNDFDGIYVFQDLDIPDAQRIIDLEEFLARDFEMEFGHFAGGDFPVCDAFWTCSTMFSNCTTKVGSKRIFLFTNEDNPNSKNEGLQRQAKQRAKDLADLGIEIEPFFVNKPNYKFDLRLFYKDILTIDDEGDDDAMAAVAERYNVALRFEQLKARVLKRSAKKRSQGRLSFWIGPDVEFGVRIYNMIQEAKKSSFVWLESQSSKPVKISTKNVCADTGALLLGSQIKYSYTYGGQKVFFEKQEINDIKALDKPCIRLMGFKPREALKDYHNIKHASFIYPDEQAIKGSTILFASMLDRMLALNKIAICKMTARAATPPRFIALLPQAEKRDKSGEQLVPPGMNVIWLPFVDDIRQLQLDEMKKASEDKIQAAEKMIKAIRINFNSADFLNPVLQKHYAHLQGLALNRAAEDVQEPEDLVTPDYDGMDSRLDSIKPFAQLAFPPHYAPDPKKTPSKAKVTAAAARSKKRARADDDDDEDEVNTPSKKRKVAADPSEYDWVKLVNDGGINRITVPDLKAFLTNRGIKGLSTKKKPELVELVKAEVESGL